MDTEAPVLNSISIRDNTLSPGDTLYIDYDVNDVSGISLFALGFKDENGNDYDAIDLNNDGVAELSINSDMLSGNYEINLILTRDDTSNNNHAIYYENGDLGGDVSMQFINSICLLSIFQLLTQMKLILKAQF